MAVSKVADQNVEENIITMDRRRGDRRQGDQGEAAGSATPAKPKTQRRRHIDPTTCERDYNNDEIEFMRAMDDYKRDAGRMFPTCSEVLEVIRGLGYVKLDDDQASQLNLFDGDDSEAFEPQDEDELADLAD